MALSMRYATATPLFTALLAATLLMSTAVAAPLDRELDTDGFDPAAESYRINEARRMNEINRQLEMKYRMLWAHGFDPASPPVDQPLGHEYKQIGPNRWEYRPVYPEDIRRGQDGVETETLPVPTSEPVSEQPLLIDPQTQAKPLARTHAAPSPAVSPSRTPAPRDAVPADRLIPQKQPRKAKPSRPREF